MSCCCWRKPIEEPEEIAVIYNVSSQDKLVKSADDTISHQISIVSSDVEEGRHQEINDDINSNSSQYKLFELKTRSLPDEEQDIVNQVSKSMVKVTSNGNELQAANGFVVEPNLIMTTFKSVQNGDLFTIDVNGQSVDAKLVFNHKHWNLSLLTIDKSKYELMPLEFASSSTDLSYDQRLMVINGKADNMECQGYGKITKIRHSHTSHVPTYIEFVSDGNFKNIIGSPVINSDGHVIGMYSYANVDGHHEQFAVHFDHMQTIIDQFKFDRTLFFKHGF